jgi:S-DNA-T family DNA segregation ATPase FtsK/SpoIIIE
MQAPLITEAEIEKIVGETARYGEPAYVELPEEDSENDDGGSGDEIDSGLIQEAWRIIQESGKTSTSYIQRRLKIGYNRAANIVEILEDRGNLSPPIGNKPREILKRS